MDDIGEHTKLKVLSCVGGAKVRDDIINLKKGVHIVVATPGRLIDLIKKGSAKLGTLKLFVLADADEMLSRGFISQFQKVFKHLPLNVQFGLFSSKNTKEIQEFTKEHLRDPAMILVEKELLTLEGIMQYYVVIPDEKYKFNVLRDICKKLEICQMMVYCNSKESVELVTDEMKKNDLPVSSVHKDMRLEERSKIMRELRTGSCRVLIATEFPEREIEASHLSLFINFELPMTKESFLKRVGQFSRADRKCTAIHFVTPKGASFLKAVQEYYCIEIEALPKDLSQI